MRRKPSAGPSARVALAMALALGLAGCKAMGPDYHVPPGAAMRAPAAQAPFREGTGAVTVVPLPSRWWHLYDDPVLDALEEQALAANTDLRVAAASLARAASVTAIAEGQKEVDFDAELGAQRARLSAESYLKNETLPVFNLGNATAAMRYQVDLFGRIRRSIEAAQADEEASAATIGAVQVTLAANVARAYIAQCGAAEGLDLARRTLALQNKALDSTRRLAEAGRLGATDVTRAQARVAQAEAALPQWQSRSRAALYALAYLMGRAPAEYPREAERCSAIPQASAALPVGDGAGLLRRRPDVRIAERQLAAATARIGVATADLYPRIGLGLSAGSIGLLDDLGKGVANTWSLGGLIRWSIPGAGARARVHAAKADADAALARFDGTVLAALRETETALSGYAEDRNRLVALVRARQAAEQGAQEAARLRAAGRAPLLADIGERQSALTSRAAEQAGREAVAQDQVTLFLALGGGWDSPPHPAP
ncbi:efflux transporter outer membrane subunit [Novosphingobium sp. FKTRR1]|uniref:efflux transporter outer membrane subunit n=1 Tax=Novosphingobium sp. FKTRR1 TaxID=2879118 RepID=UPI001CF07296|nr:efflux transporter outer membrane subunit [Novosphingobium sp. FKTRR1]